MARKISQEQFDAGLESRMNKVADLLNEQIKVIKTNRDRIDDDKAHKVGDFVAGTLNTFMSNLEAVMTTPEEQDFPSFAITGKKREPVERKTGQLRGKNAEALFDKLAAEKRRGEPINLEDRERLPARLQRQLDEIVVGSEPVTEVDSEPETSDVEPEPDGVTSETEDSTTSDEFAVAPKTDKPVQADDDDDIASILEDLD